MYLGFRILGLEGSESFDAEMTPRKQLTSSPYAFNADQIDGLEATSTAAVANALLALDSSGNLNLYTGGVSSTQATTTVQFFVPQASAPDSIEGRVYYNAADNTLYVYNGSDWQDALGAGSSGAAGAWESIFTNTALTPTSTSAGIYITASSTIAANFRVDGNAVFTGNATTSGYFVVGTVNPSGPNYGAGDLFIGRNATTVGQFEADSTLYVKDGAVGIGTITNIDFSEPLMVDASNA